MVNCADCGFLAVRSKVDYSHREVARDFREKGTTAIGYDDRGMNPHPLHEPLPHCFVGDFDIINEIIRQTKSSRDEFKSILDVIHTDRECGSFAEWQMGFSPKEHREMADRKQLQEWQAQQRQTDRIWHVVEAGILVIVAGGFTLLGALIAR